MARFFIGRCSTQTAFLFCTAIHVMNVGLSSFSLAQQTPSHSDECPYPCLPPPIPTTACPPPPSLPLPPATDLQPPPPYVSYVPPAPVPPSGGGYLPYTFAPPDWYVDNYNAPPPPDPMIPYFPWYYKHPLHPSQSPERALSQSRVVVHALSFLYIALVM